MANKKYNSCSILLFALIIFCIKENAAQQSCSSTLIGLAPCLSYVSGNSSAPSQPCCASLASVVQTQPQCLCLLLNSNAGANMGVNINQTLALALPSQCNVATPPASRCNSAANGPALSPVSPPSETTPTSPSDSSNEPSETTPSSTTTTTPPSSSIPSGSKTVPKTNSNSADKSNIVSSSYLMMAATLAVAAWNF